MNFRIVLWKELLIALPVAFDLGQTLLQTSTISGFVCTENDCDDNNDNDGDGDTDCDDSDCFEDVACMMCNDSCSIDGDTIPDDECEGLECNGPGTSCEQLDGLLCVETVL